MHHFVKESRIAARRAWFSLPVQAKPGARRPDRLRRSGLVRASPRDSRGSRPIILSRLEFFRKFRARDCFCGSLIRDTSVRYTSHRFPGTMELATFLTVEIRGHRAGRTQGIEATGDRNHAALHLVSEMWGCLEPAGGRERGQADEVPQVRPQVRDLRKRREFRVNHGRRRRCRPCLLARSRQAPSQPRQLAGPGRGQRPARLVRSPARNRGIDRKVGRIEPEAGRERCRVSVSGIDSPQEEVHGRRGSCPGSPLRKLRRLRADGHVDLHCLWCRPGHRHARRP